MISLFSQTKNSPVFSLKVWFLCNISPFVCLKLLFLSSSIILSRLIWEFPSYSFWYFHPSLLSYFIKNLLMSAHLLFNGRRDIELPLLQHNIVRLHLPTKISKHILWNKTWIYMKYDSMCYKIYHHSIILSASTCQPN